MHEEEGASASAQTQPAHASLVQVCWGRRVGGAAGRAGGRCTVAGGGAAARQAECGQHGGGVHLPARQERAGTGLSKTSRAGGLQVQHSQLGRSFWGLAPHRPAAAAGGSWHPGRGSCHPPPPTAPPRPRCPIPRTQSQACRSPARGWGSGHRAGSHSGEDPWGACDQPIARRHPPGAHFSHPPAPGRGWRWRKRPRRATAASSRRWRHGGGGRAGGLALRGRAWGTAQ